MCPTGPRARGPGGARRSPAKARAMIDPARSRAPGIVIYDARGILVFSNPTAQAVLGPAAVPGLADTDPARQTLYAGGTPCPAEERPAVRARRTGEAVHQVVLGLAE